MVTVGMNYKVIAGKQEPFERKFAQVIDALRQSEGHSETHLLKDVFDPVSYLIVSEWRERSDFDAFVASDTFRRVTKWGREAILASRPSHRVHEESADLPSHAGR
jgi:heme-degrading monooxygenase HmoA